MATRMATATRTASTPRPSTAAIDELPDRTRWALNAYAAQLLDRAQAQRQVDMIDEHLAMAELNIKAAAATDAVSPSRLAKAKLALAEATGLPVTGLPGTASTPTRTARAKPQTRARAKPKARARAKPTARARTAPRPPA